MLCAVVEQYHSSDDSAQAYDLRLFERSDHQAVCTQRFNEEALGRVEDKIQREGLPVCLASVPVPPCEEEEQKEAPHRLIQECRVDLYPVYKDPPRKIGRTAVSFTVEEVAPAPE